MACFPVFDLGEVGNGGLSVNPVLSLISKDALVATAHSQNSTLTYV